MSILILTGPAGSGKNTVAEILAKKRERVAIIDVDTVRQMLVQPHKAPWDGDAGHKQQILGVKNSCALVLNFAESGADVILLDVLSDETSILYKKLLETLLPSIVLLLPTFEEMIRRNATRHQFITDDEIEMLYKSQVNLTGFDQKIDTTLLSPEETAKKLNVFF
jgi:broad-specificity NMP kinase